MRVRTLIMLVPAIARGVRMNRASEGAGPKGYIEACLDDMINKLDDDGINTVVPKRIAKDVIHEIHEVVERLKTAVPSKSCASYGQFDNAEFKATLKDFYTTNPWSCATRRVSINSANVMNTFGGKGSGVSANKYAKLTTQCVFQDMVDKYGSSDKLAGFDDGSLRNFPGLQGLTQQFDDTLDKVGNSDLGTWGDLTFPILEKNLQSYSQVYRWGFGSPKIFAYEFLKKHFLIMLTSKVVDKFRSDPVALAEILEFYRPALLFANIEWAVNFENEGVEKGHATADPENVKLGRVVMDLWGHCLGFQYSATPPNLMLDAGSKGMMERSLMLYTVWNYRYVTYFTSIHPLYTVCKKELWNNHYTNVPHVVQHVVVSLAGSLNEAGPDLRSWGTWRGISLMMAGCSVAQDCGSGAVSSIIEA